MSLLNTIHNLQFFAKSVQECAHDYTVMEMMTVEGNRHIHNTVLVPKRTQLGEYVQELKLAIAEYERALEESRNESED